MAALNRRTTMAGGVVAVALAAALVWQPLLVFACALTGVQTRQASSPEVALAMEQAVISRLGPGYPTLPPLEKGAAKTLVNAPVPCVLAKSIGFVEASWRQAAGSVPVGAVGPVKQSPSCGYGIMQITSGMRNAGELPADQQLRIADDYRYNIGWGVRVLAEKWNAVDFFNATIGDRDPAVAEHWYYAVWAYNQFNFRNNPNNPDFPTARPAFNGTQSRLNYPYQELVWGLAANPPREAGRPLWEPVALSLPDRASIGQTPGPIPAPAAVHTSVCRALFSDAAAITWSTSGPVPQAASITLTHTYGAVHSPWTATVEGAPWVTVSPAGGGSFPATVTLQANPAGLAPGTYRGTLVIRSQDGATPLSLPVQLDVGSAAGTASFIPFAPKRASTVRGP